MWRLPRPTIFQAVDSILLGLAAAAILTIIFHLTRDETGFLGLRLYLLLAGFGLVVGVLALGIGINRGQDSVDGVFIGPIVRMFSTFCVVCAIGMLALVNVTSETIVDDGKDGIVASASDRCASAIEALERKLEEAMSQGTYSSLEGGQKGNLLQAARSVNRICPSEKVGPLLNNLRSYRDVEATGDEAKTEDETSIEYLSFAVQARIDDDQIVIGQTSPETPNTVPVTVPEPVVPSTPAPNAGDPNNNGGDQPEPEPGDSEPNPDTPDPSPQRTVTREYKLGLLPELISQILGGIGFGFGGVKITSVEIQSALENDNVVEGGQALADATAPLETASRAQLYWALIQATKLDESVGGADVETVVKALQQDHALGMCFLILSQTTNNENLDFIRNMKSAIVNDFAAVRHELKEDVRTCIDEMISEQDTLKDAQEAFTSLMAIYNDG